MKPKPNPKSTETVEQTTNRLIHEKSPYLLQHAHNPVDWYPWTDEAFEKARHDDKPVFLSIGYSSCHWCHVMEAESFNDSEVAEILNDNFVCVKVDREERPDIDTIYMSVCQMMTGTGGWPLNILMTWDKKPFFAGTYMPKSSKMGLIGLIDLVERIREFWQDYRGEILQSADQITQTLRVAASSSTRDKLSENALDFGFSQLAQNFDERYGGFGGPMKFPTPHNFLFLIRYWHRTGNAKALEMIEKSLTAIRRGGIYDHLAFGVHRYATDPQWLVPHFEKMLYDQALLAMAYTEAFQATDNTTYADTAHEIFSYVLAGLTDPEGAFYSSEDADTDGEEGKFYMWTLDEVQSVLDKNLADIAIKAFNIKKDGNFVDHLTGSKNGFNILHQTRSLEKLATEFKLSPAKTRDLLEKARKKLLKARNQRPKPEIDTKILTDWNGLMIAALAKAASTFDNADYQQAAVRAFDFLWNRLRTKDGKLLHRFREGQAAIPASLNDLAFLTFAAIELYETTFEPKYLRDALELNKQTLDDFWDDQAGGFFLTARHIDDLPIRPKEFFDGSTPAGNSVADYNLRRLARLTADAHLEEKSEALQRSVAAAVKEAPSAFTQLLVSLEFAAEPTFEIIVAGDSRSDDTRQMLKTLHQKFLPTAVVILRPTETKSPEITQLIPFAKHFTIANSHAAAYVCRNLTCNPPTTNIEEMLEMLRPHEPVNQ
jgi:hypothetical protein